MIYIAILVHIVLTSICVYLSERYDRKHGIIVF